MALRAHAFAQQCRKDEIGGTAMGFVERVLLAVLIAGSLANAQGISGNGPLIPCGVTEPNASKAFGEMPPGFYGSRELSVSLTWPAGTVVFKPGGPGTVLADGSLSMKFGWQRGVRGVLSIDGRRLDAAAPPLRARIPRAYGDIGFQATALIFPTPGCWEVTGHCGDASLTFVTRVVKIGNGPVSPPRR
jgi:hypothetical protein